MQFYMYKASIWVQRYEKILKQCISNKLFYLIFNSLVKYELFEISTGFMPQIRKSLIQ